MDEKRSFTVEEGEKVKKFILNFLKSHPQATREAITIAATHSFRKIDCESATYHILKDLETEKVIQRKAVVAYSLS